MYKQNFLWSQVWRENQPLTKKIPAQLLFKEALQLNFWVNGVKFE